MKAFVFLVSSIFCASAFAGKTEVNVRAVNFDGEKMSFEYATGGGCQEHTSEVEVDLVTNSQGSTSAVVKVYDVTAAPDFCEAMLYRTGSVDLKQLIKDKAAAQKIQGNYFDVVLPKAEIVLF